MDGGTFDRANTARERKTFAYSRRAELQFAVQLRKVAAQVGELIDGFDQDDPGFTHKVDAALNGYSTLIGPWAAATARRMQLEVMRRDESVWADVAMNMGRALRLELKTAPTGEALRILLGEQVKLIKSLPTEAAARVHRLTLEKITDGGRARELAAEIQRTGHVTQARANLIARTETARTASGLTQVRAEHVGSAGYIWRTARDSDVRNVDGNPIGSHRLLEGVYVPWGSPPVASTDGTRAHAGMIYNCRCYPEPVIPEEFD